MEIDKFIKVYDNVFEFKHVASLIKYDNNNYNLVKKIVTELNIPFIDTHKAVFEKDKNPLKKLNL